MALGTPDFKEAEQAISRPAMVQIRRAFRQPRAIALFDFYIELRRVFLGEPVTEDLGIKFDALVRGFNITKAKGVGQRTMSPPSPMVINQLSEYRVQMRPWLSKLYNIYLERQTDPDSSQIFHPAVQWRRVIDTFAQIIPLAAKDRGIYLKDAVRMVDGVRWYNFRTMNPRETELENLKDNMPDVYAAIMERGELRKEIDAQISRQIVAAGQTPKTLKLIDRVMQVGIDPVTDEATVYETDGSVKPIDQYLEERKAYLRTQHKLEKAAPKIENPEDLRKISDRRLKSIEDQPVRYVSLTDDKAKAGRLTRIYPVVEWEGEEVVAAGRYKGIYMADLVNSQGRLLEGTSFTYSPKTGRGGGTGTPVRIRPENREPYVTVTSVMDEESGQKERKLTLKIGNAHEFADVRNTMMKLASLIPTVQMQRVEGSRAKSFVFDFKDFGTVRDRLPGLTVSEAAMKELRTYFQKLAKAELATARDQLRYYSAEEIGGFKPGLDFRIKQKQALAWLSASGNKGVCALDTGTGKCVRGDTLVSTPRGLHHIQDLVPANMAPGTHVPAETGEVRVGEEILQVKNWYYGGYKPTLKIKTRSGFEIEGSRIHPLLSRGSTGEHFVKLPELQTGEFLCLERETHAFSDTEPELAVPTLETFGEKGQNCIVYPVPDRMNPGLARLLAYIVAEGWTNHSHNFSISQCPISNPETRQDIDDLLKSQFGWTSNSEEKQKYTQISSRFIRVYLEWLGVDYTLSADKIVPPVIFRSTRESIIQFVKAFIDAEGSIDNRCLEVASASEKLLREMQVLLLQLGIVSVRRPKKVKGYEHIYWRLTIQGEGARKYADVVGMISKRKQRALEELINRHANPNHDIIPHSQSLVGALKEEIYTRAGGSNCGGGIVKRFGDDFSHTLGYILRSVRNPTYRFLEKMLDIAQQVGASDTDAYRDVEALCRRHYFYDPIESIESGFCEVYDLEVDDDRHWFVGNGFVNHNTLVTVGAMQKFLRDGFGDEEEQQPGKGTSNGRFLFVCPTALRGNLPKEIYGFLTPEAAKSLIGRLDVMSYAQFRKAVQSRSWNGKRWNPEKYISIFFDEAQELKNLSSRTAKAALSVNHPRKVCLTASPMEKKPLEAYILAAVTSNIDLTHRTKGAEARRKMRKFKNQFCETLGGRVVGTNQDPATRNALDTWVKQNIYYADKRDMEEMALPQLHQETKTITMAPEVEAAYREATQKIARAMRGMVSKFRDLGYIEIEDETGKVTKRINPEARDPRVEKAFGMKFKPLFRQLAVLANYPEQIIPGAGTPKLDVASQTLQQKMDTAEGTRALLFTDDKVLVEMTAKRLSEDLPGYHACCLSNRIDIYKNGEPLTEYRGLSLPLTARDYSPKDAPELEIPRRFKPSEWQQFALSVVIAPSARFKTCTLLGQTYMQGQNLQAFDTVIHLDRDTWNSEDMKQRTARSWRQGQHNPVDEITLDSVYASPTDDFDRTLDEIMSYAQTMEGNLFDAVIKGAQSYKLGGEWFEMDFRNASQLAVNKRTMELALSPYVHRNQTPENAA